MGLSPTKAIKKRLQRLLRAKTSKDKEKSTESASSSQLRVSNRATVRVTTLDESLEAEDGSRIICAGESSSLNVNGSVRCRGNVEFVGNVICQHFEGRNCRVMIGSLKCDRVDIRDGEILASGDLSAHSIDVDKKLSVAGKTEANDIDVGGLFETGSVKARTIDAGGKFRASGDAEAEDIDVGGIVEIMGRTKARSLDVGGKARLSGGEITGSIDVGGIFESSQPLLFGEIEVGGLVTLAGPSSGGDIDVGGRLRVNGDFAFRKMDVGGAAEVSGKAQGEYIDIGGRLSIGASLLLSDFMEVGAPPPLRAMLKRRALKSEVTTRASRSRSTRPNFRAL